jgi:hypothetical protein
MTWNELLKQEQRWNSEFQTVFDTQEIPDAEAVFFWLKLMKNALLLCYV